MNIKKNKHKFKIIIIMLSIASIFILFYFFINDDVKSNLLTKTAKDLSASIYVITNTNKKYDNELIDEINKDYLKEIENLKQTLNLNTLNSDKSYINSTVIKRNTNYWYNTITIDKGEKNGIKKGLAVINNSGLVGKIINVNKYTSDVKLLTASNDENYISAMFKYDDKYYYGLIDEYDYKTNKLTLKNVVGDFDNEKIKNTDVVTTGLTDSFSSGLLIGKIDKIKKDTFGISYIIYITPTVDYNSLNIISVVVGDK